MQSMIYLRVFFTAAWLITTCVSAAEKSGKPKGSSVASHVSTSSMKERIANGVLNQPLKKETVVFPHLHIRGSLGQPQIFGAGKLPFGNRDLDLLIWDSTSSTKGYSEYLKRRGGYIKKRNEKGLISWCVKNGLSTAAEYELRRMLLIISDFRKPEYKPFLKLWLRYADKRQVRYTYSMPVKGEWYVVRDTTGHHRVKHGAAYAFDLVIKKSGKSYRGMGRKLSDYYCWGKPIVAQADGVVMSVKDSNADAPVGKSGGWLNANSVSVYYGGGVVGSYGHIQKGSAKVKVGQKVARGDVLALVGNSGASGVPHLHFTLTDTGTFSLKGRYSYERKKGTRWIAVNGLDLVEGAYVRSWEPNAQKK